MDDKNKQIISDALTTASGERFERLGEALAQPILRRMYEESETRELLRRLGINV